VVQVNVVEGVGQRSWCIQTRPDITSLMKNRCTVRNSRPPTPTNSQSMPVLRSKAFQAGVRAQADPTMWGQSRAARGGAAQMASSTILRRRL